MPIAGLVLSLCDEEPLRQSAIDAIRALPGVTLGPLVEATLPAVTDVPDIPAQDALWATLQRTPGVTAVALVCLNTEDVDAFDVPLRRLRRAPPVEEGSHHGS